MKSPARLIGVMSEYDGLEDEDKFDGEDIAWNILGTIGWRFWLRWTFGIGWKRTGVQPMDEPEPYGDTMLHWLDTWTGRRITTFTWNECVR